MLERFERPPHLLFSKALQDKTFHTLSGRAFTGHAHDNAFFFDRLLIFMRCINRPLNRCEAGNQERLFISIAFNFVSYEATCFLPIKKHFQRFYTVKVSFSFYMVSVA